MRLFGYLHNWRARAHREARRRRRRRPPSAGAASE